MKKIKASIGIDIGTSGTKLVLIDYSGIQRAYFYQDYDIEIPKQGWAEQDPETWYRAVVQGLTYIQRQANQLNIEISAIGLSGQMHSLICLDEHYKVLRPAILWADQRSAEIVAELNQRYDKETWGQWIGNPLAAGFTLPSWLWLQANEPEVALKTLFLIQPKDWVRFQLTGKLATDFSDASATGFFDPHLMHWSQDILSLAELGNENFAEIFPSSTIAGTLLPSVAEICGMSDTIPVVIGGSDQSMQAVAQGIVTEGEVSITIGSGGQVFAPISQPIHDPELRVHLFCHAIADLWHLEAATLSAGLSLKWLRKIFGNKSSYKEMADEAQNVSAAQEGLYFLPYLIGERTPWMDGTVRGEFVGLTLHHQRANLTRAVMEGVLFSLRQGLECLEFSGISPKVLIVSGGATRHNLWNQLAANIFELEIIVNHQPDASARGAAITALMSAESLNYQSVTKLLGLKSNIKSVFNPDSGTGNYQNSFEFYKQIYPRIKQILR